MDRRAFLKKGGVWLAGSLLGLNRAPCAAADPGTGTCRKSGRPAQMALIIDDIGYNRSIVYRFLDLGVPITFAVLPLLPHSRELSREIHHSGHEVMLHQPMEPVNPRLDPGPGALFVGDDASTIAAVLRRNVESIPFATGINNHMGSRFTASSPEIVHALDTVRTSGLFFIDSRTSGRSKALQTARQFHISAAGRDVFLDNQPAAAAVYHQLLALRRRAEATGSAVGIGHPFPATVAGICRFFEAGAHHGIRLVHVSRTLS